jgi:hypothetical protein
MSETPEVVERIRKTFRTPEQIQIDTGRESGLNWARKIATGAELMKLESLRTELGPGWETYFGVGRSAGHIAGSRFFYDIWPEKNGNQAAADSFWFQNGLPKLTSNEAGLFVQAFADGALSVWDEVKSQVMKLN